MALAKELQSEGSCGEQIIDNESENDNQQEQTIAPININVACSRSEGAKDTAFASARVRTYSIDSGELGVYSPSNSSDASCRICSLKSNTPLGGGGGLTANIGEADTADETVDEMHVDEMFSDIKESMSIEDSSSIDTAEDGNFATNADQMREQKKKRIAEMDQHEEFRRKAMAKRKEKGGPPTEIELKKGTTNVGDFEFGNDATANIDAARIDSSEDAIASIDMLLSTVFSENYNDPSHYANTKKLKKKKSKNKKGGSKTSKRKDRKQKGDKNDASDSTGGSWWKLRVREENDDSSNTGTARKRKNQKAVFVAEVSDSFRSISSKKGNGDFSMPKIRKGRRATPGIEPSDLLRSSDEDRNREGSHSLRSIVEDEDCEDIKDYGRVGNSRKVESVNTATELQDHVAQVDCVTTPAVTASELVASTIEYNKISEDKKDSGHGGAIGLNEMIAEAVTKRQERLASSKSPKLSFQSPSAHKESISSRLQNSPSFLIPLSPSESTDVSMSISELLASPNMDAESNEESKNSGYGAAMRMNERIAAAAAKRRERLLSGNPPKLPFQSPVVKKGSLSSRLQKKGFASPLSPPISEHSATSAMEAVDYLPSKNVTSIEAGDKKREMSITNLAADAALKRNECGEENDVKLKSFKKFTPISLNEVQRKEDKANHRKMFVPLAGEAATYGRLVRLEEHVVEGQGGANRHPDDKFNTWSGPKLRTDDRRSNALRAIQDAAAMGRIKSLTPEIVTNDSDDTSVDHFDIENQTDEYGKKILRTNFLLDRHVKDIWKLKKERMFTDSDAIGDRDDKIASYKDFDDVKLPTEILPTFDRIVRKRLNSKSFSSCADLAVIAMQMSEGNIQHDPNEDDVPQITMKRLRVLESISSAVAASACKRGARLQQPRALLKVTRKCMCPYCKDPNPYQTHKYKRLMNPAQLNDNSDQNNYCHVVGETIGTVSDAARATKSSYTISPGGRKKKIIRIVRRKKRRPKGLLPPTTVASSSEKKCVIHGTSLTPEELGRLTQHLQIEGAKGVSTEELVLIANTLRDKASTTVDATSITKTDETHNVSTQISSSLGQEESIADFPLQTATDLNANNLTTEEIQQIESKQLVSPHYDQEDPDLVTGQEEEVLNGLMTSEVMVANNSMNSTQEGDGEANLVFPAALPFIEINGDCSSTPTASTKEVTLDTQTKCLPTEITTGEKRHKGPKNRQYKAAKKGKAKSPNLSKSPSLRKPKKMIGAPPALSALEMDTQGAHLSNVKSLLPSRTRSLQNPLRLSNNDVDSPGITRLSSTVDEGEQKFSQKSFDKSPTGSPKQPFQSPYSQKRRLTARLPKRQNYREPPSTQIKTNLATCNISLSKPIPPIPSVIMISNETPEDCVAPTSYLTLPISLETPEDSESSNPMRKRGVLAQKLRKTKSLDGQRIKPRKCRSLDGQRVNEISGRSRLKKRQGKNADIAESEKVCREINGKESRLDPPSSRQQGALQLPKRSRSLDRRAITKLGQREKEGRKDRSLERRNDKSRERKKDRSLERRKNSKSKKWLKGRFESTVTTI